MKKLFAVLTVALFAPAAAHAAVINSVDRATFQAAVMGGSIDGEDFDGLTNFSTLTSLNGVSYSASMGDVVVTDEYLTSTTPQGIGSTSALATTGTHFFLADETVTFVFDTAITAFAIDINTFADTDGAYTATLNTGDVVNSIFEVFGGQVTGQFIGFVSDTAFTSLTIAAITGLPYTLDTLVWGDAADLNPSEVPLPAALPLFLIGLAGLRRFAKRRA